MILYMYIAPGQGQTAPRGRSFNVNRNVLSLHSFVASLKKKCLWGLIFYIFFMILYMYIAPGQRQTAPRGQSFDVNRNALSFYQFVASFKKSLWSLNLYIFFHDLGVKPQGSGWQPLGDEIFMSTGTSCHFGHLLQVSNKSLLSLILYIFHDFIHVYRPGAGADSPQGTKFWCQQKCLVTSFICCKLQKNSLWSLILYNLFSWFNSCI